jgi:serine acetyltransferase
MLKALRADLAIIKERDPAARGTLEILLLRCRGPTRCAGSFGAGGR